MSKNPFNEEVFNIADDILKRSQGEEEFPYEIERLGRQFVVLANVFSPKYLPAIAAFTEALPLFEGMHFLEIGSGIGLLPTMAAIKGAEKVVAVDINPAAIENTMENARRYQVDSIVEGRVGNVYEPIAPDETFDLIFWNIPFLYIDPDFRPTDLQRGIVDPGYNGARQFLSKGFDYLKPNGMLALGFSSTIGSVELIENLAQEVGVTMSLFHEEHIEWDVPFNLEIYQFTPKG